MKDEIKLIRHSVGSIDISDIKDEERTESERKNYVGQIYAVFPAIEKDIQRLMKEQILLIAEAENFDKLNFGRGTCNGISLLYELWKGVAAEAKPQPKEEIKNVNSPVGEL